MTPHEQLQDFSQKLPHEHLYAIETPSGFYGSGNQGWFSFLAMVDEALRGGERTKEFPYISFSPDRFKNIIDPLAVNARSFIDVGCGGGDKLKLVKERYSWFTKVHGVEHDPAMAIWARLYGDKVFCQDAFTIDYSKYDIVYAYWPIANVDQMNKLRDKILDDLHPTAKFVLVGFRSYGNICEHPRVKDMITGNW